MLALVAVASLLAGCAAAPPATSAKDTVTAATEPPAELEIREGTAITDPTLLEAGLRRALEDAPKDEPIFISLTSAGSKPVDPPAFVLARLADLKLDLKPVSAGELRGWRGIFDGTTGQRGRIYWAVILDRISERKVRLDVGYWSWPLAGAGEEVIVELQDGNWVVIEAEAIWVS